MTTARKEKPCKQCKTPFMPRNPLQKVCGIKCALAYARTQSAAEGKRARAAERKAIREAKAKAKTRSDWQREAQQAVNAYVRARDAGKPCISCGSMPQQKYGGTMDCGHYRSTGSAPHLRFNLKNMASQCVKCNRYLGSNTVEYRKGLIKRIGVAEVEKLEQNNSQAKFSVEYLKRLRDVFRRKLRLLVKRREPRGSNDFE